MSRVLLTMAITQGGNNWPISIAPKLHPEVGVEFSDKTRKTARVFQFGGILGFMTDQARRHVPDGELIA